MIKLVDVLKILNVENDVLIIDGEQERYFSDPVIASESLDNSTLLREVLFIQPLESEILLVNLKED